MFKTRHGTPSSFRSFSFLLHVLVVCVCCVASVSVLCVPSHASDHLFEGFVAAADQRDGTVRAAFCFWKDGRVWSELSGLLFEEF